MHRQQEHMVGGRRRHRTRGAHRPRAGAREQQPGKAGVLSHASEPSMTNQQPGAVGGRVGRYARQAVMQRAALCMDVKVARDAAVDFPRRLADQQIDGRRRVRIAFHGSHEGVGDT